MFMEWFAGCNAYKFHLITARTRFWDMWIFVYNFTVSRDIINIGNYTNDNSVFKSLLLIRLSKCLLFRFIHKNRKEDIYFVIYYDHYCEYNFSMLLNIYLLYILYILFCLLSLFNIFFTKFIFFILNFFYSFYLFHIYIICIKFYWLIT